MTPNEKCKRCGIGSTRRQQVGSTSYLICDGCRSIISKEPIKPAPKVKR